MNKDSICWMHLVLLLISFARGKPYNCRLTPPTNGKIQRLAVNVIKYTCSEGFKLVGPSRCLLNGKLQSQPRCKDTNECTPVTSSNYPCDDYADCINNIGSYKCFCRPGYHGDGYICTRDANKLEGNFLIQDDSCGIVTKKRNNTKKLKRIRRIIGGNYAEPGDWPWMALITINEESSLRAPMPIFSGVLIKPGWVLTIASLLHNEQGDKVKPENIIVSLGENDRNKPENEEQQFQVKEIIIHKNFRLKKNLRHDIALIKLSTTSRITDDVNTICLVNVKRAKKFEKRGHLATIAGWGLTEPFQLTRVYEKGHKFLFSGVLQDITLPILGSRKCRRETSYHFNRRTMLCAGMPDNAIAPCIGDAGSPLTMQDPVTKRWILLGLYSWSEGCAQPSKFSYYTRVSKYRRWIKMKIDSNENQ